MAETSGLEPSKISPVQARQALKAMQDEGTDEGLRGESFALLASLLAEFEAVRGTAEAREAPWPACDHTPITSFFASDHLGSCRRHPARLRLEAVLEAIVAAPSVPAQPGLEPRGVKAEVQSDLEVVLSAFPEREWWPPVYFDRDQLESSLEVLTSPGRAKHPTLVPEACVRLGLAVRYREHAYHRETDPCPWCGQVFAPDETVAHLLACERHPAAFAAARGEAELFGREAVQPLVAQLAERRRQLDGLADLVKAHDLFDRDLSWNGYDNYAHRSDEEILRDALGRARRVAGVETPTSLPGTEPRPAAAEGSELGQLVAKADGPVARWSRETELTRAATVRLIDFAVRSLGSSREDERGRAVFDRKALARWERARNEARETLRSLGGDASRYSVLGT